MTQPEMVSVFPHEAYTRTALPGDASTRRYFRLNPSAGPGPASSLILMIFEGTARETDAENFLKAAGLFASLGCPVPAIIHAAPAEGTFVLEDLGDVTLEQVVKGPPFPRALYDEAIEIAVRIQARSRTRRRDCPAVFGRSLDAARIGFELDYLRRHGLEREKGLSAAEARAVEGAFAVIIEEVAALPRVLNHRDYHSRNLMVRDDGLALVDFQDALMASPFYDVASLLRDSYTDLPAAEREALLEEYLAAARTARVPLPASDEEATALYDLVSYQRNVKALGTFAFQGHIRGRTHFLDAIPNTLRLIEANLAASLPSLAPLTELIMERFGGDR